MIRNDISHLQPENQPLTPDEILAQMIADYQASSVMLARDHQRADPNFDGVFADPVGMDDMGDDEERKPIDGWESALQVMQDGAW